MAIEFYDPGKGNRKSTNQNFNQSSIGRSREKNVTGATANVAKREKTANMIQPLQKRR